MVMDGSPKELFCQFECNEDAVFWGTAVDGYNTSLLGFHDIWRTLDV
jgi:hypothetical protein